MNYLAHSAKDRIPEQSYLDHVQNVMTLSEKNVMDIARYNIQDRELLLGSAVTSAYYHDMGKLLTENQNALHQNTKKSRLPINHVDAGTAYLKQIDDDYSALTVYSHHRGLPNLSEESMRKDKYFRDEDPKVRSQVDAELGKLVELHKQLVDHSLTKNSKKIQGDKPVFLRMLLSCVADADHTDTAHHYGNYPEKQNEPSLKPEERLKALDNYVSGLKDNSERSRLRSEMYKCCKDSAIDEKIVSCDSPVGSGKTTAVMAYLLKQAEKHNLRRIFVVLPFTNIIEQSVDVYRKALVLPDEDPEEVVAELHHRADFENEDVCYLTSLWKAPIVVTTAVAFFETLASNRPSTLRRLHELPGSIILVDEAHAALPLNLLPTAWRWMDVLADEWQCRWVLASGSLIRYWNIENLIEKRRDVPEIVNRSLRDQLMQYEQSRINFSYKSNPLSRKDLEDWVVSTPGPRLLIMNTVQSAAVIAKDIKEKYGKDTVLHLSTALTSIDRDLIVNEVKERLKDKNDTNWTLVATSCVEAGVDFSFKTGFREIGSLLSLLQASGRVNRGGVDADSEMWSFTMQDDILLTRNPAIKRSSGLLEYYFQKGIEITPQISTRSIEKEIEIYGADEFSKLEKAEAISNFKDVEKEFRVIDKDDSIIVITDSDLADKIRDGRANWMDVQKKSVPIRSAIAKNLDLHKISDGMYEWHSGYDSFLGIMKGILERKNLEGNGFAFI